MPHTRRQTSFATAARAGNAAGAVAKIDVELDRLYAELDEARAAIGDTRSRLGALGREAYAEGVADSAGVSEMAAAMAYRWAEWVAGPVVPLPEGALYPSAVENGMFSAKWWALYAEQAIITNTITGSLAVNGTPHPGAWFYSPENQPIASPSGLGMVRVGGGLTITQEGVLATTGGGGATNADNLLAPGGSYQPGSYFLDLRNATHALNLADHVEGKLDLSAHATGSAPLATKASQLLRTINAGTGLTGGGQLTSDRTLSLTPATANTIGGVKPGEHLMVRGDGTLDVDFEDVLEFKGVIDATAYQSAPSNPRIGDVYITQKAGTADPSWTGLVPREVSLHELLIWDGTQWDGAGTVADIGVKEVDSGAGIAVSGTPDQPIVSVDDTVVRTTGDWALGGNLSVAGDLTVEGQFNATGVKTRVNAGAGLSGGGELTSDVTITLQTATSAQFGGLRLGKRLQHNGATDAVDVTLADVLEYRGTANPNQPAPSPVSAGDVYIASAASNAPDSSWGLDKVTLHEVLLFDGTNWDGANALTSVGVTRVLAGDGIRLAGTIAQPSVSVDASVARTNAPQTFTGKLTLPAMHTFLKSGPVNFYRSSSHFYIFLDDVTGEDTYNDLRPFYIDLANGRLSSRNGQYFSGGSTFADNVTIDADLQVTGTITNGGDPVMVGTAPGGKLLFDRIDGVSVVDNELKIETQLPLLMDAGQKITIASDATIEFHAGQELGGAGDTLFANAVVRFQNHSNGGVEETTAIDGANISFTNREVARYAPTTNNGSLILGEGFEQVYLGKANIFARNIWAFDEAPWVKASDGSYKEVLYTDGDLKATSLQEGDSASPPFFGEVGVRLDSTIGLAVYSNSGSPAGKGKGSVGIASQITNEYPHPRFIDFFVRPLGKKGKFGTNWAVAYYQKSLGFVLIHNLLDTPERADEAAAPDAHAILDAFVPTVMRTPEGEEYRSFDPAPLASAGLAVKVENEEGDMSWQLPQSIPGPDLVALLRDLRDRITTLEARS